MDAERWARIARLLEQAMDCPPEMRADFLAANCAGDDELRREVESLLEAHSHSESFLSTPAFYTLARHMATERGPSLVGKRPRASSSTFALEFPGNQPEKSEVVQVKILLSHRRAGHLLPKEYGDWNAVYKRFARWAKAGVFEQLHQFFAGDPDLEHLLIVLFVLIPVPQGH